LGKAAQQRRFVRIDVARGLRRWVSLGGLFSGSQVQGGSVVGERERQALGPRKIMHALAELPFVALEAQRLREHARTHVSLRRRDGLRRGPLDRHAVEDAERTRRGYSPGHTRAL